MFARYGYFLLPPNFQISQRDGFLFPVQKIRHMSSQSKTEFPKQNSKVVQRVLCKASRPLISENTGYAVK